MKFDRKAPGEGAEAICRLENGKALLEWRFYVTEDISDCEGRMGRGMGERPACGPVVRVTLTDQAGNVAAECMQALGEEEPLEIIMVQPGLWQGIKDPCQYRAEAVLAANGRRLDRLCFSLPLRSMEPGGRGEVLLNGTPVALRAVAYSVPDAGSEALRQRLVQEDLRCILNLGANCVYVREKELSGLFLHLCDRLGLLAFAKAEDGSGVFCPWNKAIWLNRGEGGRQEEVPDFRGGTNAFFSQEGTCPEALYYKYKARWCREPFVYILPESLKQQKSGNYTVACYSNCSRLALYSDGVLFEFQQGDGEFVFQEVPAKSPCIMLSAEGEGCSGALSVHKSFLKILGNPGGRSDK